MNELTLNECSKKRLDETYLVVYAIKNEINIKKVITLKKVCLDVENYLDSLLQPLMQKLLDYVNCKIKLIKKFKIELIKYYQLLKQYMKLLMNDL